MATIPNVNSGDPIDPAWGNLVADELNAVQATADGKVSKSGDTMTGVLVLQDTDLSITEADGTEMYRIYKLADGDNRLRFRDFMNNRTFIEYDPAANILTLGTGGNVTVRVPAISGPNQAAQVAAYDPTTGRLEIGDVEMGDTRWRDVSGDLVNGWTATRCQIRRIGSTAWLYVVGLDGSAATSNQFLPMYDGFYRDPPGSTIELVVPTAGASVTHLSLGGNSATMEIDRTGGGGVANMKFEVSWPLGGGTWPSVLPGTAA